MERDPHLDERIADEKHPIARMIALGVVASLIGIAIVLWIDWFPAEGSTAASKIDTLYDVLLICSVPVFVLVMTIVDLLRLQVPRPAGRHARRAADPRQHPARGDLGDDPVHHGHRARHLRLGRARRHRGQAARRDGRQVTGRQFAWTLQLPRAEGRKRQTSCLPKDQPVEFRVHTDDVLHDFWVPAFRLKTDAVPGLTTKIRVTPDRLGRYNVVCAELCGLGHSTMRARTCASFAAGRVHGLGRQAGARRARERRRVPSEQRRDEDVTLTQKLIAPGWYRAALGVALGFGFGMAIVVLAARSPTAGTRCCSGTRSSPSAG